MYKVELHSPTNTEPWVNCPYRDSNFASIEEAVTYALETINHYPSNTSWLWRITSGDLVLGQWAGGSYETLELDNYINYSFNLKPTIEI